MRVSRAIATTAAALTVLVMAGCGGSDESATGPTKAAATDADGFTPEQREVVDAVVAYTDAFFGRGTDPVGPAVEDLVTDTLMSEMVPAETKAVDKAGLQYVGDVTVQPEAVTIDGDRATFRGCSDGSAAFVVKKGQKTAGVGSRPVGTTDLTVGLVRRDGLWLVDSPRGKAVQSC